MVILGGVPLFVFSLYQLLSVDLNLNYLLLVTFTSLIATRISIKFPNFNGTITVSDAFIFISLLMWGTSAAVVAAVAESITLTYRLKSKLVRTYLFNIASSTLTTWMTGIILIYTYGRPREISQKLTFFSFVLAMCLMAMSYFLSNMTFTAIMQMLKLKLSLWKTWTQYYLWTCVTFFFGAALAGTFVKLFDLGGIVAVLLVTPILILFYTAYQSYIRTVAALQASESRFRSSFDYATIGMGIVSPEGNWIQVNKSLQDILQFTEEEFLNSNYQNVIHPDNLPEVVKETEKLVNGKIPAFQFETRLLDKTGDDVWVTLGASTALDSDNEIRHLIFQIQDITSRKSAEEKLWFDANHDALTGLPNRASFQEFLDNLITGKKTYENPLFAVLFLDLDGFKMVNDSLGHLIGDELLKNTSQRLLECIRGNDMVARIGGDEFTILLVNLKDISQVFTVAERIKEKLSKAFQLADQEIFIGTSIGIAVNNIEYQSAVEMLRDADAAMYRSKALGKGCYTLFDQSINDQATKLLRLANDLRQAVEREELTINYQPIFSIEKNKVVGFESLIRWLHPTYGELQPSEFLPLAEENGLMKNIDNWVMLNACQQIKEWQNIYPQCEDLFISVNMSSRQFEKAGLFDTVKEILIETELLPKNLQLEIKETAMIKNLKTTLQTLKELNLLGVKIALDDFGTGYSSLNYLHELPISVLKIDRSFVCRLNNEKDGVEILKAIIALAESLEIKVVAEGIETNEQLHWLKKIKCHFGQGYLYSPPITNEESLKLLESQNGFNPNVIPKQKHPRFQLISNG